MSVPQLGCLSLERGSARLVIAAFPSRRSPFPTRPDPDGSPALTPDQYPEWVALAAEHYDGDVIIGSDLTSIAV